MRSVVGPHTAHTVELQAGAALLKSVRDKGAAEVEEARRATAAALTDRDALKDALASVREIAMWPYRGVSACLIAQYLDPCLAVVFHCVRQVKSEVATLTARVESLAADASASECVNAAIQEEVGALQACDWLLNWMASSSHSCVHHPLLLPPCITASPPPTFSHNSCNGWRRCCRRSGERGPTRPLQLPAPCLPCAPPLKRPWATCGPS